MIYCSCVQYFSSYSNDVDRVGGRDEVGPLAGATAGDGSQKKNGCQLLPHSPPSASTASILIPVSWGGECKEETLLQATSHVAH